MRRGSNAALNANRLEAVRRERASEKDRMRQRRAAALVAKRQAAWAGPHYLTVAEVRDVFALCRIGRR